MSEKTQPILVLGGTGKTGRRVVKRLADQGEAVRIGSRRGEPRFDWEAPTTWGPALRGARAAYVAYHPDFASPGAVDKVGSLAELAVHYDVSRLVLLAGRGEAEAELAEEAVRASGAQLTVLRSSWFAQNFSEDYMLEHVLRGVVALPAGDVAEPFIDADDIADVAVAALTNEAHIGQVYELTGPRPLTFSEAVAEIARATGREIRYVPVTTEEHAAAAARDGVPVEVIELLTYLFREVLDGRNVHPADGVQRTLGREPRDFAQYARDAAATGIFNRPFNAAA